MALLKERYQSTVVPSLREEFGYGNPFEVPRVDKVTVSMGLGEAVNNSRVIEHAQSQLANITGQRPIPTRARKSIAGFRLRKGMPIGVKTTLRRERMFEFLERLFYVALPRVRDFKGVSPRGFDGRGNYSLGIREQIIFPEIDYDSVDRIRGMNITIVTTAETDDEARRLLGRLGMPFRS